MSRSAFHCTWPEHEGDTLIRNKRDRYRVALVAWTEDNQTMGFRVPARAVGLPVDICQRCMYAWKARLDEVKAPETEVLF